MRENTDQKNSEYGYFSRSDRRIDGFRNKIDDTFSNGNFLIDEFSTPNRLDRNLNGV